MKILVTGAAGFIASHIVDRLVADGHEVIGLDSLDPGVWRHPPSYLRSDVQYIFRDLRYWEPGKSLCDIDAIVHAAALGGVARASAEHENVLSANVLGTLRLVNLAKQWPIKRFILTSSFSVYGSNYSYKCPSTGQLQSGVRAITDLRAGRYGVYSKQTGKECNIQPITEAASPNPMEGYGASKFMQELVLRGVDSIPTTIFRFSSVYGDRLRLEDSEATIIAKLAGWIRAGVPPQLLEDGEQIRDWVYVGDIVQGVSQVLQQTRPSQEIINVCSGVGTTLRSACSALAKALRSEGKPQVVGGFREGDMRHCLGDAVTFTSLLGRYPITFAQGAELAFSASR